MNYDEKMWYSLSEAATYLGIDENRLQRKIIGLNIATRPLPGQRGEFIPKRDLLDLEVMIRGHAIVMCIGSQVVIEQWVRKVASATQTHLNWAYQAGHVIVYILGEGKQRAIEELQKPEEGVGSITLL
jgi:hypothetical protein